VLEDCTLASSTKKKVVAHGLCPSLGKFSPRGRCALESRLAAIAPGVIEEYEHRCVSLQQLVMTPSVPHGVIFNLIAMVPQMVMHVLYVSRHRVQNGVILMVG
jgi:hypothetical protein